MEIILLADISSVTMERGAGELRVGLLQDLYRVCRAVIPVMIVRDNLGVSKSITVHERSQGLSDIRFLGRGEPGSGIGGVTILRLILNTDGVCGDALVLEPLQ